MAKLIYQGAPSSQIDFQYTPNDDDEVLIKFTASAFSATANIRIGFSLFINGVSVGSTSFFSNGAGTHRLLTPAHIPFTFPLVEKGGKIEPVTFRIEPMPGTSYDVNDWVSVVIL